MKAGRTFATRSFYGALLDLGALALLSACRAPSAFTTRMAPFGGLLKVSVRCTDFLTVGVIECLPMCRCLDGRSYLGFVTGNLSNLKVPVRSSHEPRERTTPPRRRAGDLHHRDATTRW
jgi:hypothetical protein